MNIGFLGFFTTSGRYVRYVNPPDSSGRWPVQHTHERPPGGRGLSASTRRPRWGGGGCALFVEYEVYTFLLQPSWLRLKSTQMKEIAVETLRARLKVLDEEYQENRKILLDAIQTLGDRTRSKKSETASSIRPRNGASDVPNHSVRSISDAVKIAFEAMPGNFTLVNVRDYLRQNFPELFYKVSAGTIGARVWEAHSEKIIELVSRGQGGKPNIYARKK
jgi:hypothetical protein